MSDYLWDKQGEVDPEIERLENQLGELRYQPRALNLPPAIASPVEAALPLEAPTGSARAAVPLHVAVRRWPAMAAAAALVLMLLGGAWFAALYRRGSQGHPNTNAPAEVAEGRQAPEPTPAPERAATETIVPKPDDSDAEARAVKINEPARARDERRRARGPRPSPARASEGAAAFESARYAVLPAEASVAVTQRKRANEASVAAIRREQQEAKEQLMYALRLTGTKLNQIQKRTQETNSLKSVSEEQNKTR